MTHHIPRRRTGLVQAIAGASMVATLALTGCSQGAPAATEGAAALPSAHIHGISRDPGSGKVNLATHEGLNVLQPDGSWKRVGPEVDLMGFAVSGPGTFYASGHPGAGVEMPNPVGLIKSTDAGATWTILSREGVSDFHALTSSSKGVMGFDDGLRITTDGTTWSDGALSVLPTALAAAPDGSRVLAATQQGLLSSTDDGRSWERLVSAPTLALAAWADAKTVVGVTYEGRLALSADAGLTWRSDLATLSRSQALSASRDKAGVMEILVVTEKAVFQSRDNGATLTELTS